jgi:thiamine-monophosphate kinase
MTEDQFLESLFARLPPPPQSVVVPPGDDCAAIAVGGGRLLLLAVDQVVGGRHFEITGAGAATPEEVGRKLLARNLSDIAAMGGVPKCCLVAVGMSHGRDQQWLRQFFAGLLALAAEYEVDLIGGDLATTPADDVLSLTVTGDVRDRDVVRRSGASAGDALFATGLFGSSLATRHHLLFSPRCREGRWLAENGWAQAMIDVSDGLLLDAQRLCAASKVALELDPEAVPRRTPATSEAAALTDGEDYELLVAIDRERAPELEACWPFADVPLTRIGAFVDGAGPEVVGADGRALLGGRTGGWDHFDM